MNALLVIVLNFILSQLVKHADEIAEAAASAIRELFPELKGDPEVETAIEELAATRSEESARKLAALVINKTEV